MAQTLINLDTHDRIELGNRMLEYFVQPRIAGEIENSSEFQDQKRTIITDMVTSLRNTGDIAVVNGRGGKGAIYQITSKGRRQLQYDSEKV